MQMCNTLLSTADSNPYFCLLTMCPKIKNDVNVQFLLPTDDSFAFIIIKLLYITDTDCMNKICLLSTDDSKFLIKMFRTIDIAMHTCDIFAIYFWQKKNCLIWIST